MSRDDWEDDEDRRHKEIQEHARRQNRKAAHERKHPRQEKDDQRETGKKAPPHRD